MKLSTLFFHAGITATLAVGRVAPALAQCGGNRVIVTVNTDANGGEITWQLSKQNTIIQTGGPFTGQNFTQIVDTVCLGSQPASTCYKFKLNDSGGNGMSGTGSWKLTTLDGKVLIADQFANGPRSPRIPPGTSNYQMHTFCLPTGQADILSPECGVFTNALNNKVHCKSVPGATQYQFEILDPDSGFLQRIVKNTSYFTFMDLNSMIPLAPGKRYFVRTRTNVNGSFFNDRWGGGCEMGLGYSQVVQCTGLVPTPAYGHSCNETRAFGSTQYSFIYATPVLGATAYTFHIYIPDEPGALDTTITRNTYILQLKWPGTPMQQGLTYNVDVKTTVNGVQSDYCAPFCTVTIDNSYTGDHVVMAEPVLDGDLDLWPNPTNGKLQLALNHLADPEQRIDVAFFDLYGRQVNANGFNNSGSRFSTVLDLPAEMTNGLYLARITVNGKTDLRRVNVIR
jgi:hypothetical protein